VNRSFYRASRDLLACRICSGKRIVNLMRLADFPKNNGTKSESVTNLNVPAHYRGRLVDRVWERDREKRMLDSLYLNGHALGFQSRVGKTARSVINRDDHRNHR